MNKIFRSGKLPVLVTALGVGALVLRLLLYMMAVDGKGLLLRNHPLSFALIGLTAAAFILIVLAVQKQNGSELYENNYSASLPAALGHVAMAAGILVTVLTGMLPGAGHLAVTWWWLGIAAPVCLAAAGVVRMLGRKPFFLLHVVPCLFLVVHIVSQYQVWSSNPQMQDYVFALLGTMTLMFFSFYTAAMEADCGNRRMTLGMGLAAVYLCLTELARSSCPLLYLGGILWVLTSMCRIQGVPEKKEEEIL